MLTAIFWLLIAIVLGMIALYALWPCVFGAAICAMIGIAKGILVMIDYHRENKNEE